MEVRYGRNAYTLKILDGKKEWYNEANLKAPIKLYPRLESKLSEKVSSRVKELTEAPNELELRLVSEITDIIRPTLYKKIREGNLRARKRDRRYVVRKNEVLGLLSQVRPVEEGWPTAQEMAERYGLSGRKIRKWVSKGKIRGLLAIDHQVHIHPSEEGAISERSKAERKTIEIRGEEYIHLPEAIKKIMNNLKKKGVPPNEGDYSRFYDTYKDFIYLGGGKRGVRKGERLFMCDMLPHLKDVGFCL